MKKLAGFLATAVLGLSLTACGSGTSATNSGYTTEFPYLPSYSSPMELQEFTELAQSDYSKAYYIIKDTKNEDVLVNYEKILTQDGWTVYEDKKPLSVALEKEDHVVMLLPQQVQSDVNLQIVAK